MLNVEQLDVLKKITLEMAKNYARNTNNQVLYNFATAFEEADKFCNFQQLTYNLNFSTKFPHKKTSTNFFLPK